MGRRAVVVAGTKFRPVLAPAQGTRSSGIVRGGLPWSGQETRMVTVDSVLRGLWAWADEHHRSALD